MAHDIKGRFVTVHVNPGLGFDSHTERLGVVDSGNIFSTASAPIVSFDVHVQRDSQSESKKSFPTNPTVTSQERDQLLHEMTLAMQSLSLISQFATERRAPNAQFERVVFTTPQPLSESQKLAIQAKIEALPNIFAL